MIKVTDWRAHLPTLGIALVLGFVSLWLASPIILTGSWFQSHDGMRYPYLVYRFKEALSAGVLYPRWLPDLMGGYGYPTFVFYQPGFFYFTMPFAFLFSKLIVACYAAIVAMLALGGWGAYLLARRKNGRALSTVLAVLFLLSPYVATNMFIRGDFSELFAIVLLPWSTGFALRLCDRLKSGQPIWASAAGFVLFTAAVVVSHPFVAFFYIPFIMLLFAVREAGSGWRGEILLTGLVLLGMAAVLSAPYWFTLFQLKEEVRYQGAISGYYTTLHRLRPLYEIFFAPRLSVLLYTLLAFGGFALAWKSSPIARLGMCYMLFLLFMASEHSRLIWEIGDPVLKFLQFPWRQQSVNTLVMFMGICALARPIARLYHRRQALGMAVLALLVTVVVVESAQRFRLALPLRELAVYTQSPARMWPVLKKAERLPPADYFARIREREQGFVSMAGTQEFHPKLARTKNLINRLTERVPAVVFVDPAMASHAKVEMEEGATNFRYNFVLTLDEGMEILLNQFYFPGWKITVDGKPIPWLLEESDVEKAEGAVAAAGVGDNGRIRVLFPETGSYNVVAWYDGPPGWQWRNAFMVLALGVLFIIVVRRRSLLRLIRRRAA